MCNGPTILFTNTVNDGIERKKNTCFARLDTLTLLESVVEQAANLFCLDSFLQLGAFDFIYRAISY